MGGMLQDKVIIVTGGGSGIGATSARLFAEEGAWVVVADRDAAQGAAVVDQIGALGHKARFIAADVSHEGQVESMIGTVLSENGRIDGAFNNAGIGPTPALIADCSESGLAASARRELDRRVSMRETRNSRDAAELRWRDREHVFRCWAARGSNASAL